MGFPTAYIDTEIKQFIDKLEQPNIDNNLNHKQLSRDLPLREEK